MLQREIDIIGASVSEPHTNCEFAIFHMYMVYIVPYILIFFFDAVI